VIERYAFHKELGIIDWFFGTHTLDELIGSYKEECEAYGSHEDIVSFSTKLKEKEKALIETIELEQNEKPHIIRYFVTPNFSGMTMDVSVVAKIDNNGSTYIFTDNPWLFDMYTEHEE